jgi:hypothetical protein
MALRHPAPTRLNLDSALGAVFSAARFLDLCLFGPRELAWKPFTQEALDAYQRAGRTVLVIVTADWDAVSRVNEAAALNTVAVRWHMERLNAIALEADWTEPSDEIKNLLGKLGSGSIPLVAIFPGDRPNEPILLRDLISTSQVLDALAAAGPSRAATSPPIPGASVERDGANTAAPELTAGIGP